MLIGFCVPTRLMKLGFRIKRKQQSDSVIFKIVLTFVRKKQQQQRTHNNYYENVFIYPFQRFHWWHLKHSSNSKCFFVMIVMTHDNVLILQNIRMQNSHRKCSFITNNKKRRFGFKQKRLLYVIDGRRKNK